MSSSMQAVVVILALGVLVSSALPADYFVNAPMDKKSANLRDFMSAMKNTQRLRYGKRSLGADYESEEIPSVYPMRMMLAKRMGQNLPQLIDSLNGAERLRFGK